MLRLKTSQYRYDSMHSQHRDFPSYKYLSSREEEKLLREEFFQIKGRFNKNILNKKKNGIPVLPSLITQQQQDKKPIQFLPYEMRMPQVIEGIARVDVNEKMRQIFAEKFSISEIRMIDQVTINRHHHHFVDCIIQADRDQVEQMILNEEISDDVYFDGLIMALHLRLNYIVRHMLYIKRLTSSMEAKLFLYFIKNKHFEFLDCILQNGEISDSIRAMGLLYAMRLNARDIVNSLKKHALSISAELRSEMILKAAQHGYDEVFEQFLLSEESESVQGRVLLSWARNNRIDLVKKILMTCEITEHYCGQAFICAVRNNCLAIAIQLIESGNILDSDLGHAFLVCIQKGHLDFVPLFKSVKERIYFRDWAHAKHLLKSRSDSLQAFHFNEHLAFS